MNAFRPAALPAAAFLCLALFNGPPARAAFDLPPLDKVLNYQPKLPLQVLTSDGVEIAQFGSERRIFVPIAKTPKLLQDAVLAIEDARFREHSGIDPKGIARAVVAMVTGGRRQGASTITQQMVRNVLLSHERSVERKAKEIMLSLEVEKQLSKDRILEIYFNEIYLGQRSYGFAAAAQTYFGKPMDKLSIAEAALLAGLPQNPHYANPVKNFERAVARQRLVLARMKEVGVITEAQATQARAEKLTIRPPGTLDVHAEHVADMARRIVVERFGQEAYSRGLRVTTSLRAAEQRAAWVALRKGVLAYDRKGPWRGAEDYEELPGPHEPDLERAAALALKEHKDDPMLRVAVVLAASTKELRLQLSSGEQVLVQGDGLRGAQAALGPKAVAPLLLKRGAIVRVMETGKSWALTQWPEVQAAVVSVDAQTGRVRALVGGFDFTRQPFNHVTQAWRQPGSSFKPFLYSAALESGVMPATVIDDSPFVAANGWAPQNSDGRFDGPLSLREALARSRNLVSVRLLQQVGVAPARDWAGRFGLELARQPDNLTLALGSGSVTPMQMAQAYAVFANGGYRVNPVLIERITDATGKVLFAAPPPQPLSEEQRVLPARNAFVMQQLLAEVTRSGTAAKAQAALGRSDIGGKTGTTNEAVDAWFVGFQASVATAVWVGFDDPRSLGDRESGGGLALPIWIDTMAAALKGVPGAPSAPPGGLLRRDDWLYEEWADGGAWARLPAEGPPQRVPQAPPPLPVEPAASANAVVVEPKGEPVRP
jgi:penicillin-binding protein 1A